MTRTQTDMVKETIMASLRAFALVLCLLALISTRSAAQVGDVSWVDYPGWQPSDRVLPLIVPSVSYDTVAQVWRLDYTVFNGPTAEQEISDMFLAFDGSVSAVRRPTGWYAMWNDSGPRTGAGWHVEIPSGPIADVDHFPPGPAQIPPGDSLSGFGVTSRFVPLPARSYVQGYAPVPFLPAGYDDIPAVPHDTTDSQRGWTLAPGFFWVDPFANQATGNESLLAVARIAVPNGAADVPAVMLPPLLGVRVVTAGETFDPSTLRAVLNGVDVTHLFHPREPGSNVLVGVMSPRTVPLVPGSNTLEVRVQGVPVGGTAVGLDVDQVTFTVKRVQ